MYIEHSVRLVIKTVFQTKKGEKKKKKKKPKQNENKKKTHTDTKYPSARNAFWDEIAMPIKLINGTWFIPTVVDSLITCVVKCYGNSD